jgi:hypothetical protein
MSTGLKSTKYAGIAVLCLASLTYASGATTQHKAKKPQLPPLPSGPTGPVPQIPLDSITPVAPQVSYQNGQLTIVAPNSTLGDILRAVKKQTGAEIEIPVATERVVTHLGPGPARDVVAELLNGSRFNYVLLGSAEDSNLLTRVVLVAKSGPENVAPNNQVAGQAQQPAIMQAGNLAPAPQDAAADASDADAAPEENADDAATEQQAAEAEQPAQQPDQPGVKTPQQMLQEMQQRQLQMQQQAGPGMPPVPTPGSGMPPHPPQEP